MHHLKAKLASLFSSSKSKASRQRPPLRSKALAAVVPMALVAAFAVVPSLASATVVTPAATEITLTQSGQQPGFVSANAYAESSIQCKKASAKFTTPTTGLNPGAGLFNYNKNQPAVGTQSTGNGSVTMDLKEPPKFEECAQYELVAGAWVETEITAVVTANETSGKWTLSATNSTAGSGVLAIGVPPSGAKIVVGGVCTITVSPNRATSVNSIYLNLGKEAQVDGQITDESPEACGGPSPAQFEAQFKANNGFEIN